MGIKTAAEVMDQVMEDLRLGPLVYRDEDGFVFVDREHPGFKYEISRADCDTDGNGLRWVAHMACKSWVTTRHLEQFALLLADDFGGFYP